jgi:hypothetical protein
MAVQKKSLGLLFAKESPGKKVLFFVVWYQSACVSSLVNASAAASLRLI